MKICLLTQQILKYAYPPWGQAWRMTPPIKPTKYHKNVPMIIHVLCSLCLIVCARVKSSGKNHTTLVIIVLQ